MPQCGDIPHGSGSILTPYDTMFTVSIYSKFSMHHNKGFTLVELLIVVALIGIITGIVVVTFSGSLTGSERKKSKAHVGSVIRLVEQEKSIGTKHTQIAEALNDPSFELWEKVVGSFGYLSEYVKNNTNRNLCNTATGKVYEFLDVLDGSGQSPVGSVSAKTAANTATTIHCIGSNGKQTSVAIRVSDSVWWCGNLYGYDNYNGFFTTASSGKLENSCAHSDGDGRTNIFTNKKNLSMLTARVDDYYNARN